MSIHALAEKCLIVWRLNPSTAPLEHANKIASASDVPCMSELSVAVAYVKCINKLQWNLKGACQKILLYDAKQMTSFTWLVFVAAGKKNCDRQVYLLTVQKTRWQDFDVALVHRHPWSLITKRTIVTRNLRAVRSVWVLRTNRKPGGKK